MCCEIISFLLSLETNFSKKFLLWLTNVSVSSLVKVGKCSQMLCITILIVRSLFTFGYLIFDSELLEIAGVEKDLICDEDVLDPGADIDLSGTGTEVDFAAKAASTVWIHKGGSFFSKRRSLLLFSLQISRGHFSSLIWTYCKGLSCEGGENVGTT